MPQLSAQASITTYKPQLVMTKLLAEQAQQIVASFIFPSPLVDMNKMFEAYFAPLREMQETMNKTFALNMSTMLAEIVSDSMKSQKEMLSMIVESSFLNIAKAASIGMFPSSIIDAEIIDKPKDVKPAELANAVISYQPSTSALTIPEQSFRTRGRYGLAIVARNSVMYKRKTLKGVSARNVEGRFLIYLLSKPNLFISDEEIREQFHILESRSASWILRDLRNKFKNNGLKIDIERRWNPDGYILIDVRYLH